LTLSPPQSAALARRSSLGPRFLLSRLAATTKSLQMPPAASMAQRTASEASSQPACQLLSPTCMSSPIAPLLTARLLLARMLAMRTLCLPAPSSRYSAGPDAME
ncbi:hypothetical protein IWW57_005262, partial [Coemansia sp. S610]